MNRSALTRQTIHTPKEASMRIASGAPATAANIRFLVRELAECQAGLNLECGLITAKKITAGSHQDLRAAAPFGSIHHQAELDRARDSYVM